ncbi:MAG: hypothetical protein FJ317_08950, partial [SAR202 cluster bacterium]|nr:hypothetical protein [SAR202 cluster bacterium]
MTFLPVIISIAAFALIVAGIVALVNRMRNRTPAPVTDEGIGTAKRLYIYIVAFAALAAAVSGVTQIGQFVLDGL